MLYEYIRSETEAGIATLTLNRPDKLNALYGSMREEIVAALAAAAADGTVGAVIVTGAGRGFCAGGDIAYMATLIAEKDEKSFRGLVAAGAEVVRTVRSCPKPVIAAVNGPAAGGGMNLALACDLRLASQDATFAQSFVKIGMHPDWGGTYLLPRLIGVARAMDLVLTGRAVKADEALALGIVNRVVPGPALIDEARALARSLADGPPLAIAAAKRNLYQSLEQDLETVLEAEIETQLRMFRSADAREGMAAFREKRRPGFKGA